MHEIRKGHQWYLDMKVHYLRNMLRYWRLFHLHADDNH